VDGGWRCGAGVVQDPMSDFAAQQQETARRLGYQDAMPRAGVKIRYEKNNFEYSVFLPLSDGQAMLPAGALVLSVEPCVDPACGSLFGNGAVRHEVVL
jgi:hypothetical protein